jgi:hypothetical protein
LKIISFNTIEKHKKIKNGHKTKTTNLDKINYKYLPKKKYKLMNQQIEGIEDK